ncbi:hypothetical protein QZH41_013052, partial [Actinostola sp. cb2023]
MSVIGFDVGNQSCYIAVARGGGIETITNEYSDRSTPCVVSLGEKTRQIGTSGKNQMIFNLKNTISQFKRFMGKNFSDPVVQHDLKDMPYQVVEQPGDAIGIKVVYHYNTLMSEWVRYLGEVEVFTPEQVMGMILSKLKTTAERWMETKVTDCVISVPSYYTDRQRRSMLDASSTAGLNCLRLINDSTAVALAYGIYKQDLPTDKPRNIVFVDMGHASLQVAVCAFLKGQLKVLSVSSDPNLGGRDFDKKICHHFIEEFKTKYKIDIMSNGKARMKLTTESEKVKKQMSSISNDIPLNIECLMEDKDVSGKLKRVDFEGISSDLVARFEKPLRSALDQSGLKAEDITAVEIVGGATRIPMFKNVIKSVYGLEPNTTLNADEAVSRGCALQCAMLSPTFRVREFSVNDITPYPIVLTWNSQSEEDTGEMELFTPNHSFPFLKMLTFYRKEPFELEAHYKGSTSQPIKNSLLGESWFSIKNVVPSPEGDSSKVKVRVRMDGHGIFSVCSAQLVEKIPSEPEQETAEPMDTAQEGQKKEEQQQQQQQQVDGETPAATNNSEETPKENNAGEQPMDVEPENKKDETKEENSESKNGEASKPKKKKQSVKTTDLPVESVVPSLAKRQLLDAIEKENSMIMQDRSEQARSAAKNSVEEYVYNMRNNLIDKYDKFITEGDRDKFSNVLEDAENWLYDEGEEQSKKVYQDKLASLKKLGDPVETRYKESLARPEAFNMLGKTIQQIRKVIDLIAQKDEKYDHLTEEEIKKLQKAVKEKEDWFNSKSNAQAKVADTKDPAVLSVSILAEKQ